MNILMMTNTYLPHVGGVARSVESFAQAYRRQGHRVLVVAPTFEDAPSRGEDVVRVPAIQRFNGSDFSVRLPIPGFLTEALDHFYPQLVHAHHPFLLGDTAARVAAARGLPLVFTHHTMYERYTHYVPGDSPAMKQFVVQLATGYANMCDAVIAPSQSIAQTLRQRGVSAPVEAVPTGIDRAAFSHGDGPGMRRKLDIPENATVVGHVGRLAPEKNLVLLATSVGRFMQSNREAYFLVVGDGPSDADLRRIFASLKLEDRLRMAGRLVGQPLVDAYHAMDAFAFASVTETQGLVLAEAMAASVPVVAVDAPGVREVVRDRENGRLVPHEQSLPLTDAIRWVARRDGRERRQLRDAALRTAEAFDRDRCAERVLRTYARLISRHDRPPRDDRPWSHAARMLEAEWELWSARAQAAARTLGSQS